MHPKKSSEIIIFPKNKNYKLRFVFTCDIISPEEDENRYIRNKSGKSGKNFSFDKHKTLVTIRNFFINDMAVGFSNEVCCFYLSSISGMEVIPMFLFTV